MCGVYNLTKVVVAISEIISNFDMIWESPCIMLPFHFSPGKFKSVRRYVNNESKIYKQFVSETTTKIKNKRNSTVSGIYPQKLLVMHRERDHSKTSEKSFLFRTLQLVFSTFLEVHDPLKLVRKARTRNL